MYIYGNNDVFYNPIDGYGGALSVVIPVGGRYNGQV